MKKGSLATMKDGHLTQKDFVLIEENIPFSEIEKE
jgi:hypothetical protein